MSVDYSRRPSKTLKSTLNPKAFRPSKMDTNENISIYQKGTLIYVSLRDDHRYEYVYESFFLFVCVRVGIGALYKLIQKTSSNTKV